MGQVEETLIQVKKTAAKDSFNYGGRLNDQIIMLLNTVESADAAPTQQDYQLFEALDRQLQDQLTRWSGIKKNELPHLNEAIHQANVCACPLR